MMSKRLLIPASMLGGVCGSLAMSAFTRPPCVLGDPPSSIQQKSTQSNSITVERVAIVDKHGRTRAELVCDQYGMPRLHMFDRGGRPTVTLEGGQGLSVDYLEMTNKQRREEGKTPLGPEDWDGEPSLMLMRKPRDSMGPFTAAASACLYPDSLELKDKEHEAGSISLQCSEGFTGENDDNYAPLLQITDGKNKTRAVLGSWLTKDSRGAKVTNPPSSLLLFDDNGKIIFRAPR